MRDVPIRTEYAPTGGWGALKIVNKPEGSTLETQDQTTIGHLQHLYYITPLRTKLVKLLEDPATTIFD